MKQAILYGPDTSKHWVYHRTEDGNEPLCWHPPKSKLDDLSPGYDDPSWTPPRLVTVEQARKLGRHQCRHCERKL